MKRVLRGMAIVLSATLLLSANAFAKSPTALTNEQARKLLSPPKISGQTVQEQYNYVASKNQSYQVNEYDLYKSLISQTDEALGKKGMSKPDIQKLRTFDYKKAIIDRSKESIDTLKAQGYSDAKISALKSFAANSAKSTTTENSDIVSSNAAIAASIGSLSATLTSSVNPFNPSYYRYNDGTGKYVYITAQWAWNQLPFCTSTDVYALSWSASDSAGHPLNTTIPSWLAAPIDLTYRDTGITHDGQHYFTPSSTPITYEDGYSIQDYYHGASNKIEVLRSDLDSATMYWASAGSYMLVLQPDGSSPIYHVQVRGTYGHTSLGSPSVSFAIPPSVSISFSANCTNISSSAMLMNAYGNVLSRSVS